MTRSNTAIRALVIDDEALARKRLISMLASHADVRVVGEAESGSTAVAAIVKERPDVIFLDVQMPGLDGFGVLRCTAGAHRPAVVFVTAFDEHAVRAFEVHAADYLVKPVTAARLSEAVARAVQRARGGHARQSAQGLERLLDEVPPTPAHAARIPVRNADGVDLVPVRIIRWVEADRDHARLHTGDGMLTLRDTMSDLEERLRPFGFVRVHRSAIVNIAAVRTVESNPKGDFTLVLSDGTRVRAGRSYRDAVQALKG